MKLVGLILIAFALQSCFFHRYYKDESWWYFEDWDINKDRILDKNEFHTAFMNSNLMEKISPKSDVMTYAEFEEKAKRIQRDTGEHPETKPAVSLFDLNADQKLSKPEVAEAMFTIADQNSDSKVSGLEFYEWEVYLEPRDTVTTVTTAKR